MIIRLSFVMSPYAWARSIEPKAVRNRDTDKVGMVMTRKILGISDIGCPVASKIQVLLFDAVPSCWIPSSYQVPAEVSEIWWWLRSAMFRRK